MTPTPNLKTQTTVSDLLNPRISEDSISTANELDVAITTFSRPEDFMSESMLDQRLHANKVTEDEAARTGFNHTRGRLIGAYPLAGPIQDFLFR